MKHEVKFKTEREAMLYSVSYNRAGVKAVLTLAKKSRRWNLETFQFALAFAGIQGFPAVAFHKHYKRKELAV